jgi:threonine/homoserine/homoserine lactone efflux protein
MFGTQHFLTFLVAAIALNLTPGQDTLYIIGRSLAQGRRAGILSVLGIGSGCLVHMILAGIGLYSVLALWQPAFAAITLGGAFYLIFLGVMTWFGRKSLDLSVRPGRAADSDWQVYRQGLFTNLLNPKVALFFIAFLPQFIDPATSLGPFSFMFLGFTFFCTGTAWCMVVAVFAASVADTLRKRPNVQTAFDLFTAVLFVCLGIAILIGHL